VAQHVSFTLAINMYSPPLPCSCDCREDMRNVSASNPRFDWVRLTNLDSTKVATHSSLTVATARDSPGAGGHGAFVINTQYICYKLRSWILRGTKLLKAAYKRPGG
jgi:hypothetical protein